MKNAVVRFTMPAAVVASVAFSPVGSTSASAAAPNLAAQQPAHWVTEAYTVPAAIPVDGDGNPHPTPPGKLSDCHISRPNPSTVVSVCNGPGTGQQRITSACQIYNKFDQSHRTLLSDVPQGKWVGQGQRSEINCGRGQQIDDQPQDTRIEFRGWKPQ